MVLTWCYGATKFYYFIYDVPRVNCDCGLQLAMFALVLLCKLFKLSTRSCATGVLGMVSCLVVLMFDYEYVYSMLN
jgi:hypothetical protein